VTQVVSGWITSAAVVGILIASVGYFWQRQLEHGFLLRKEKRDLFRDVSRKMAVARSHVLDDGYLSSAEYRDLNDVIYELDILGCGDVRQRAIALQSSLHSFHDSIDTNDPGFEGRYFEFVRYIARLHASIVTAMKIDLEFTPEFFWQQKKHEAKIRDLDDFREREEVALPRRREPPE
jgi:hypothetical protein